MAFRGALIARAKSGALKARKAIPEDVRDITKHSKGSVGRSRFVRPRMLGDPLSINYGAPSIS
jgi:hypothetical protein